LSSLNVIANGTNQSTEPLASMDSVVARDFKDELPIVITKTIAAAVVKGVASYAPTRLLTRREATWRDIHPVGHRDLSDGGEHRRPSHLDDAAQGVPGLPRPDAGGPKD